jgi:hypothetical protein
VRRRRWVRIVLMILLTLLSALVLILSGLGWSHWPTSP